LDIGGGSTELILGLDSEPTELESLNMGCVVMTERFFSDGKISETAFYAARLAVRLKLRPVKAYFGDTAGIEVIGTSGTIRATEKVARELGIVETELTYSAVEELIRRVQEFGNIESLDFPGLSERRAQVWPGGLAILVELLSALHIDHLKTTEGALREGLLYDSLGRLQHEDARERSVQALARRYNTDQVQAGSVCKTALGLLTQCAQDWRITSMLSQQILQWSALLHEIGLDVSHDGFQRHGAYIAAHADLPGFPRTEQQYLAFLIANQRRHIDMEACDELPPKWRNNALRLSIVLRLAVLLNRSRSQESLPPLKINVVEDRLQLEFPDGWLEQNPLTRADLEIETAYLREVDYDLSVS